MKSTNVNLNEKSCKTQNALIAEWLLAGNTITDKIARKEFDCSRISARIHNLKNDERRRGTGQDHHAEGYSRHGALRDQRDEHRGAEACQADVYQRGERITDRLRQYSFLSFGFCSKSKRYR